jgi:uncharacterized protein (TIGR00375 family)
MNWRLRQLDPYVMVSNSDAHSAEKLAREATIYDTDVSYHAIRRALSDADDRGLVGTVEFYPQEGKYHYDGHRNCQMRMNPKETKKTDGKCPVCGKTVTVGVMSRVEELADEPEGRKSPRWRPYYSLIPLPEIIAEAKDVGANSQSVKQLCMEMFTRLGNEMNILLDIPIDTIEKVAGSLIAEGISRVREGKVHIAAGYDGEYGKITIFSEQE